MISLIVAFANNRVIGSVNDLPWYLPADLRHFKQVTLGHTVVMGRKTHDSIRTRLGGPLPERTNIVLTRDGSFQSDGFTAIHGIDEVLAIDIPDLFIIGGAEIYRQMLPHANRLLITEIHADIPGDAYFPEYDMADWREVSRENHAADERNPYDYSFVTLERV
jgi:dihydrofolate reductase